MKWLSESKKHVVAFICFLMCFHSIASDFIIDELRHPQLNFEDSKYLGALKKPNGRGYFEQEIQILNLAQQKYDPAKFKIFRKWFLGFNANSINEIFEDNFSSKLGYAHGVLRYDSPIKRPFEDYLKARKYLYSISLKQLTAEKLNRAHSILMGHGDKKIIQGIREKRVGFKYKLLEGSEGIYFETYLPQEKKLEQSFTIEDSKEQNLFLKATKESEDNSMIVWYPDLEYLKELDLKTLHSDASEVEGNRVTMAKGLSEALSVLVEIELAALRRNLDSIDNGESLIGGVSDFSRNVFSLRPYKSGNKRIIHLLVEKIFSEFNMPLPIWGQWNNEALLSQDNFKTLLKYSFVMGEKFANQVLRVLNNNLSMESVSLPFLMNHRNFEALAYKSPEDFMTWVYTVKMPNKMSIESAIEEFISLEHPYEVQLAPLTFQDRFNCLSRTKEDYRSKMRNFYFTDDDNVYTAIYRGFIVRRELSKEEVLNWFLKMKVLGNGVKNLEQSQLRNKWCGLNKLIANNPEKLIYILDKHVEGTSEVYRNSGFYSSSLSSVIAKRFNDFSGVGGRTISSILIKARRRSVGCGDMTGDNYAEDEFSGYVGIDPESITKITILTRNNLGKTKTKKIKVKRLSYLDFSLSEDRRYPEFYRYSRTKGRFEVIHKGIGDAL